MTICLTFRSRRLTIAPALRSRAAIDSSNSRIGKRWLGAVRGRLMVTLLISASSTASPRNISLFNLYTSALSARYLLSTASPAVTVFTRLWLSRDSRLATNPLIGRSNVFTSTSSAPTGSFICMSRTKTKPWALLRILTATMICHFEPGHSTLMVCWLEA